MPLRIDDPGFPRRLLRLLQSRGTNPETPKEIPFVGAVITLPGEALLENARRSAGPPTGKLREITLDPAAGAELIFTVPEDKAWKVQSIKGTLVTSATVITRLPRFFVASAAGLSDIILGPDPANGQLAGETVSWTWARGLSRTGRTADLVGTNECPDIWIVGDGNRQVGIATLNFQAGDNWGLSRLWVDEYDYSADVV